MTSPRIARRTVIDAVDAPVAAGACPAVRTAPAATGGAPTCAELQDYVGRDGNDVMHQLTAIQRKAAGQ